MRCARSTAAQIKAWAAAWIAAVQKAFPGQRVGVYTSSDDIAAGRVPDGVPLWYPAYPGTSVETYAEAEKATQPKPSGRAPLIWQFTSTPATGPHMDLDIAYMTEATLRAWAAGDTPETSTEDDDMPEEVNLGVAKPFMLQPGAWDSTEFTSERTDETGDHIDGSAVFVRGKCKFAGSVSLRVQGLPAGQTVQVRMSEFQGRTPVQNHPIDKVIGTAGDAFHVTPLVKHLASGRSMRVRLLNNHSKPVTITSAVLTALVWKA